MSYLDVPRIHFNGTYAAHVSTRNNLVANFETGRTTAAALSDNTGGNWRPDGTARFVINAKVTQMVDSTGTRKTTSTQDPLIGADLHSQETDPTVRGAHAYMADLDVESQTYSTIFALYLELDSGGNTVLEGKMDPAALEVWMDQLHGDFQSVLRGVRFASPSPSPILTKLQAATSGGLLSIRFVLVKYNFTPATSGGRPPWGGLIRGAIGPYKAGEPLHFVGGRRCDIVAGSYPADPEHGPYRPFPFIVDTPRNKVVVDVSNCFPEDPAGNRSEGTVTAVMVKPAAGAAPAVNKTLGPIDITKARFDVTAGIEEVPLLAADTAKLNANHQLVIHVSSASGFAGTPAAVVIAEDPKAIFVDTDDRVIRLDPGDTKSINFRAFQRGSEVNGADLEFTHARKAMATGDSNRPPAGLTFPATGKTGTAVTFTAHDPGRPRDNAGTSRVLQGQLYWVKAKLKKFGIENVRILVKVYSKLPAAVMAKGTPTFSDVVQHVLDEYARLYPSMQAFFDMKDYAKVKVYKALIDVYIHKDHNDPYYMPVTRDMSKEQTALLSKWCKLTNPPP